MTNHHESIVAKFWDVVQESFAKRIENIYLDNGVYMADWVFSKEISTHLHLEKPRRNKVWFDFVFDLRSSLERKSTISLNRIGSQTKFKRESNAFRSVNRSISLRRMAQVWKNNNQSNNFISNFEFVFFSFYLNVNFLFILKEKCPGKD